jgi:Ca-activated chloride channel homolog
VSFGTPMALLGLLVVPLLIVLVVVVERRRGAQQERFGTPALLSASTRPVRPIRRLLPLAVALVALSALVVGVARPRAKIPVPGRQATVILALDSSRSMAATDVKPSRLAAAVGAARTFLDAAPKSYSVGIVSFSTRASLVLSPTTDRAAARTALDLITLGSGTAIGDAIDRSVVAARPSQPGQPTPTTSKIPATIVFLSDGEQTTGDRQPLAAATHAKQLGIPINTIALGTRDAVVDVPRANGVVEKVTVVPDTKMLQQIARITGGRYAAAPTAERLKQVYKDLGSRVGRKREQREVTAAFAGAGVFLLLLASGLSLAWSRRPL